MARFSAFKPNETQKKKSRLNGFGRAMVRAKKAFLNVFSPKTAPQLTTLRHRDLFHPSIHRTRYPRSRSDSSSSMSSLVSESSSAYPSCRKRKANVESPKCQHSSVAQMSPSVSSAKPFFLEESKPIFTDGVGDETEDGSGYSSVYLPHDHRKPTDFRSETRLHQQELKLTPFLTSSPAKSNPPVKKRRVGNINKNKLNEFTDLDDTIHNITMTMPTVDAQEDPSSI
ncbi:unnamed protein product [Bursaphelenchus okinawaensis]|uniref:Uncharacterized protein n=1 Tax=Bursaphelenchus okinawaensis TaxID=465554 RepID=A0A811L7Y2_9BILA|nr:unnamed protein product [Bursaphelenchus okinawaensis]CAG9118676.1 unnamed protein product [Bursaphelenchus okinawaensis]